MSTITQAKAYLNEGLFAEALAEMDKLIQTGGPTTELLEMHAYTNQKLGHFEAAMEEWNVLLAHNAQEGYYYMERGVCKFNLRFKSAIDDFKEAIRLEPNNAYFHSAIAYIYDKMGRLTDAVNHYHIAIELEPDNEITINNLAVTEQKRGNMSKAEELFKATDDLLIEKGLMPERPQKEAIKPVIQTPEPVVMKTKKQEMMRMLSSWTGFKAFLAEAREMLFGKKD